MKIDPFTVTIENTDMVISGSYGIDKSLNFDLILKMPASELRGQTANALTNLVGKKVSLGTDETIDILVSIGGTYDKPIIKASLGDIVKSVTSGLKQAAVSELESKKDEVKQGIVEALTKKKTGKDSTAGKSTLEQIAKEKFEKEKKEAEKKVKDKLKNLFKKKKN